MRRHRPLDRHRAYSSTGGTGRAGAPGHIGAPGGPDLGDLDLTGVVVDVGVDPTADCTVDPHGLGDDCDFREGMFGSGATPDPNSISFHDCTPAGGASVTPDIGSNR